MWKVRAVFIIREIDLPVERCNGLKGMRVGSGRGEGGE
jgi:hypothetical protein